MRDHTTNAIVGESHAREHRRAESANPARSRGLRDRSSHAWRVGPGACAQSSFHPAAAAWSANTRVHSPARRCQETTLLTSRGWL
jgi:hypothetical protein